jgi:quinol monooxygenase YgiN
MTTPVTLINILSVDPANQQTLLASLKHNTETVITSLKGWIATTLIASHDGTRVVIYSQWETAGDVAAMRDDPRMQAYFPSVAALATLESMVGEAVMSHER